MRGAKQRPDQDGEVAATRVSQGVSCWPGVQSRTSVSRKEVGMRTGSGIRGSASISAVGPGAGQRWRRVGLECLLDRLPRTRNPDQMSLGTEW